MTPVAERPLEEIRAMLRADGYSAALAAEVRAAAARGALLWTPRRLTTTDASRLDERPEVDPCEEIDS